MIYRWRGLTKTPVDAFDENGKLRDGITRIRIKLVDAASERPTKVVDGPGFTSGRRT